MNRAIICLSTFLSVLSQGQAQQKTLEQLLIEEGSKKLAVAAKETGDSKRGALIFHRRRSTCTQCHAAGQGPSPLGPDLAKDNNRSAQNSNPLEYIIDSILAPSKVVDPRYRAMQVLTDDGLLHIGLVAKETDKTIALRHPANINQVVEINKSQIENQIASKNSLMPKGVVNQLKDRQQFLDLVVYLDEIKAHGPQRAKQLLPSSAQLKELTIEKVDHVSVIRSLRYADQKAGRALYAVHCASCHGAKGELAINPLARRFAKDKFNFGSDPYSIWKTISYGKGLMFRWDGVLTAKERYQLVHFIREEIIKPNNPDQYFKLDDFYLKQLPELALKDARADAADAQSVTVATGMIDGTGGRNMVYGPFLQHGMAYSPIKDKNAAYIPDVTEKAIVVNLPGNSVICYDAHRLSVSGLWRGPSVNTEQTHHTSYKGGRCLTPGREPFYKNVDQVGWTIGQKKLTDERSHFHYNGLYLAEDQVVLSYSVGGRRILELPGAANDGKTIWRTFKVGPGNETLFSLVANGDLKAHGQSLEKGNNNTTWLKIPPSQDESTYTVVLGDRPIKVESIDVESLTRGGPRRWPQTVQTAIAPGKNLDGYAFDELIVPLANPWGSWMRTTALDFFSDGRMAVSTLSGDVWVVRSEPKNPNALTWSRFAAGLYEPLGLKIVDDIIYVRGRDRITRLVDLNKDGEADFYENFYEEPNEIGASYHAFIYELHTDKAGNFYFTQSGYKSPLTGAVVKLSPNGKNAEFIGTDLRNPNGMGSGGPKDWITVADNPSGKAIYNGFFIAKKGALYGHNKGRTVPMLVTLPARVDSSSGGQCWSHPTDWGPLSGSVVHGSYSRCNAFYCLIQDIDPYPNGFAVQFPIPLKSGGMRPRINPVDKQVYLLCHKGWDTTARFDGVIYRIRHTGKPVRGLTKAIATSTGLELTFGHDLNPASVNAADFSALREPDNAKLKPTNVALGSIRLVNSKTVAIEIPNIEDENLAKRTNKAGDVTVKPPMSIAYKLESADGIAIEQTVFATINSVPSR